jgi:hypothetical protein
VTFQSMGGGSGPLKWIFSGSKNLIYDEVGQF